MMLEPRPGWTFPSDHSDQPQPPDNPTIEAVGLLIRQESTSGAPERKRSQVWFFGTMISEVFGPRAVGWLTSSLRRGRPLNEEPTTMTHEKLIKQRDDELEAQLISIVRKPELAEQVFPDPQMREKVVPLLQYMRKKVQSGEQQ